MPQNPDQPYSNPLQPAPSALNPKALRVCIVAENASFRFGGEASLPLHYFSRLRQRGVEVWLIVHGRTRPELEALFPSDQARIQYIPDRWYHKLIWQASKFLPRRVSEATFGTLMVLINQVIQRSMVKRLVQSERINIVHQPIPVSPKAPSFIYGLGIPIVIGPMNGGMDFPPVFRGAESLFTRVAVSLGRASANLVNTLIPGKRDAAFLLVANFRTQAALPTGTRGDILEVPENGVDLSIWTTPTVPADPTPASIQTIKNKPSRFVFVGRLVDWKRLDFVLHALAKLPGAHLDVIGDGPMRAQWTGLAHSLNIDDRVQWLGWRPQPECAHILQGATALVLPSIYECGGAVVLEAMACGTPVIATAWGGPADYLDQTCGILVPVTNASSPDTIQQSFAEAMRKLAGNPVYAAELSHAGRKRVENLYDWNQKIDRILEIYSQAIYRQAIHEKSA